MCKFLNFLIFLSLVCLSMQQPIDCKSDNLASIPHIIPNKCAYLENITSVVQKFTPSNQILTQEMMQSLFNELKIKVNDSFNSIKQKYSNLFVEFAQKDPNGLNATNLIFANLTANKNQLNLSVKKCNEFKSDLDDLQSKLNLDGVRLNKKIFCLIASDMKKNMPVTMAVFLFKNGKSLSALEKSESANLAPFKDLMLKIMAAHHKI